MSKKLSKYGLDSFIALQLGLESAAGNNTTKVLEQISFVLGDLLNAAISAGDILTAAYFMKAGASANFGISYFQKPRDAFVHHAALTYFKQSDYYGSCPSEDDVMQAHLEKCYSCSRCNQSLPDIELFNNHFGQYIEYPLLVSVQQRNIEAIKFLSQNGADQLIDCGNYCGNIHTTPFSYCVSSGFVHGVEMFLECGIDINKEIHAAVIEKCSESILKVFLRAGLHHTRITHVSALAIAAGSNGCIIPKTHREQAPVTLKFMCRKVVRQVLLENRLENLFVHSTLEKLSLPRNLCAYLVCNFDIMKR